MKEGLLNIFLNKTEPSNNRVKLSKTLNFKKKKKKTLYRHVYEGITKKQIVGTYKHSNLQCWFYKFSNFSRKLNLILTTYQTASSNSCKLNVTSAAQM